MKTKEQIVSEIKKYKWYRQAGNSKTYYIFIAWFGVMDYLKSKLSLIVIKDRMYLEGVYNKEEFITKAKEIISNQKKDGQWIDNWLNQCRKQWQRLQNLYQDFSKFDFNKASFEQIRTALQKLDKIWYYFWLYNFVPDCFDPNGDELLQAEIKQAGIKLNQDELTTLLRPEKLSYLQEERLELLKNALQIKRGKYDIEEKDVKKFLKEHADKYYYVGNSWELSKVLTVKDFKAKLKELISENSVKEIEEQIKDLTKDWTKEQEKIIKKNNITGDLPQVLHLYRNLFFLRDERKKYVMICAHYYDKFFSQLSKMFNINFKDLNVALIADLKKDFDLEKFKAILKSRKHLIIAVSTGKDIQIFAGNDAQEIYDEYHKIFIHEGDLIRGNCACSGQVKGKVRIVMGEPDFAKFNSGEILIAPMTRPEYVPIIKKALAIITDEGGITSHAAIVSRELNIPCVIGTQVATKALTDGDIIEVNADKGIIKKL